MENTAYQEPLSTIWKITHHYTSDLIQFMDIRVYEHVKNFNNNGDKFLIDISVDGNDFILPKTKGGVNNPEYEPWGGCVDTNRIQFIVVGEWELRTLLDIFSKDKNILDSRHVKE